MDAEKGAAERIAGLAEALAFYADNANWRGPDPTHEIDPDHGHSILMFHPSPINQDHGARARAALRGGE